MEWLSVSAKFSCRRGLHESFFSRIDRPVNDQLQLCRWQYSRKEIYCDRLSSIELHFLTENGHFAFQSPLWRRSLGATYAVHFKLIGKRVVDFLLAIIELFRDGVAAETLQVTIYWKSAFCRNGGPFSPKFKVEGVDPTNRSSCRKTRKTGSFIWYKKAEVSFILSQFMRVTVN